MALPATGYFINAARTNAEAKTGWDDTLEVIREGLGGSARSELTIDTTVNGDVTPPVEVARQFTVDTFNDEATGALDHAVVTNVPDGGLMLLSAENAAHVVTLTHGAGGSGQLLLRDGVDYVLDALGKWVLLMLVGTAWEEVWRTGDRDLRGEILTTSGTVHTYSGIGRNAVRHVFSYRDISHSGAGTPALRLRVGDGTIKTAGYNRPGATIAYIDLSSSTSPANLIWGRVDFQLVDVAANRWMAWSSGNNTSDVIPWEFTLTNPLSDMQLDWSGGETFDSGAIGLFGD